MIDGVAGKREGLLDLITIVVMIAIIMLIDSGILPFSDRVTPISQRQLLNYLK